MIVRFSILFLILVGMSVSSRVNANKWHSYLSYYQIIAIAQGDQGIFAANINGLFSYEAAANNFETWSRVEGLSDSGISAISWSGSAGGLLIGYSNGNLDLLKRNSISNLPDIRLKTSLGAKSVNHIFCEGDFAWLSCDFGIVKINLKKWEVAETWIIGPEASQITVNEIAADGQYFWAATSSGIFKASKSNPNLQDYRNWTLQVQRPEMQTCFNSIAYYNNRVYACNSGEKIYAFDGTSWMPVYPAITGIHKIRSFSTALLLVCDKRVEIITPTGQSTLAGYGMLTPASSPIFPSDALVSGSGEVWIGDRIFGLMGKRGDGSFLSFVPPSPADNYAHSLTISGNNLYVATGQDEEGSESLPAGIHRLQDNHWFSLNSYTDKNLTGIQTITNVVPSPLNPDHFMGTTRENGLLEFEGNKLIKNYNSANSPLESYNGICKTGGGAYDAAGNLWITNPAVKHQLHVIKPDGVWKSLSYPGIDNQFVAAGELMITKNGTKWIIVNNSDLFALRTNNTIDNTVDDLYKKSSVRSKFSNSETTIIKGFNQINAIAEDQNGYLWVGTESGIVVYYNPEALFGNNEFYGTQPSVNIGDGLFHPLLENVRVSAVAIDGGNRKWFGTTNSGVFLFSEDGSELISHFNTDNSPLFSNNVSSIAVNGKNGEVYFATEGGLISWMGNATEGGSNYQHLYVWPNPVRESYYGDVTVDGLLAGSDVKITDVTGNLIFKTTSNGGRAVWNGRKGNGDRVSTGVYLIFCTDSEGNQSRVIKLLFIR